MKKLLTLVLAVLMAVGCCFGLTACGEQAGEVKEVSIPELNLYAISGVEIPSDYKVGFIFLHDEKSTYDLNFYEAAKDAILTLGLKESQVIYKFNIPEGQECYTAAKELVEAGCKAVFADSFGHEDFMIKAAKDYPNVQFCHATGTKAHTENLANYHNAFANIYEGRYLAGIAAGMKLNEMIANKKITADNAKMGYVGAFTYAEVISGYTSFYLGAKSVCPSVTMDVQFTGSWYDEVAEKSAAEALISKGCVLISQHADSMGAPSACEAKNVPNVSYNGSTIYKCPNTFIISSRINWTPFFVEMIAKSSNPMLGEIKKDTSVSLLEGAVVITSLNQKAMAEGTVEAIYNAMLKMARGQLNVFDTKNFTLKVRPMEFDDNGGVKDFGLNPNAKVDANGHVTSYMADVDTDPNFMGDTEVIMQDSDGGFYFSESTFRSAPYFDLKIDGITLLNSKM